MRALSFLLRLLLLLFVDGGDGVGAFDLMFELVAVRAGHFGFVLPLADLAILLRRFLALHLRALQDGAGEWIDLSHIHIRGESDYQSYRLLLGTN